MTQTAWRPARLQEARRTWTGTLEHATDARHWLTRHLASESAWSLVLVEQAAGELISNALRHSCSGQEGGRFTVSCKLTATRIVIGVIDEGALPPVAGAVVYPFGCDDDSVPLAESGRGLLLLAGMGIGYDRQPFGERGQVALAYVERFAERP